MNNKLTTGIAAFALTGALALGGTAFASGGDDSGSGPTGARAAEVCANLDTITEIANGRIAEMNHRIDYLTNLQTKATAAGKTELATRIGTKITKLNERLAKVTERLAKLPAWAAEHCTPAPAPAPAG